MESKDCYVDIDVLCLRGRKRRKIFGEGAYFFSWGEDKPRRKRRKIFGEDLIKNCVGFGKFGIVFGQNFGFAIQCSQFKFPKEQLSTKLFLGCLFTHFSFLCFTFLKFDFQRYRLKHRFMPIIPRDHFLLLNSSLCSIGSHLHVWVQTFLYFFQVWDFCISFIRPYSIFGLAEIQILAFYPF